MINHRRHTVLEKYIETEEFFYIPKSGSMYRINTDGVMIYDKGTLTGQRVPIEKDANGQLVVHVSLWRGLDYYPLAVIVALTFKPIHVTLRLWDKLSVLFKDRNHENIHPSNLIWKFPKGGLLHPDWPGYAYIPGFTRYIINEQGHIVNHINCREKSVTIPKNKDLNNRYITVSMTPDVGHTCGNSQHRLLGLAWLEYDERVDRLVVNHLNAIKTDNRLENLEWATKSRDVNHAFDMDLRSDNNKVLMRNVLTNEILEFRSQAECSRYLGLSDKLVDVRLKSPNQPLFPGYFQFKLKEDPTPWREVSDPEGELNDGRFMMPILVRNVKTNEITEYESAVTCSKALNCSSSAIDYRVKEPNQRLFAGYLQYKYKSDTTPWREPVDLEEEERQAQFDSGKIAIPILVKDTKTGSITRFNSIRECGEKIGIAYATILRLFRFHSQPYYSGYRQFKIDDGTEWSETIDCELEERKALSYTYPSSIYSRNIFTGEVQWFKVTGEAELKYDLPEKAIVDYINKSSNSTNRIHPLKSWDFKRTIDTSEWNIYSDEDLEFYKLTSELKRQFCGKGYIRTTFPTGEKKLYVDINEVLLQNGITKGQLVYCIKTQNLFQGKFQFRYYFS